MVSLAFHVFVTGIVIFASISSYVKSKNYLFLQRKLWVPHIKSKDNVHM